MLDNDMSRAFLIFQVIFNLVFQGCLTVQWIPGTAGNGIRSEQTMSGSNRKRRGSKKAKGAPTGSFVKIELERKIHEARRRAKEGVVCACTDPASCEHGNPIWLTRVAKLEMVKGPMAVALYNLPTPEKLWIALDALRLAPKAKKPLTTKSSPPVSLKSSVLKLMLKAKEKSATTKCDCIALPECNHATADTQAVWERRFQKLEALSVEDAAPLLPHLGTEDVWSAVDSLVFDVTPPMVDDWDLVMRKPDTSMPVVQGARRCQPKISADASPRLGSPEFDW